jgi:hypothetical protein
MVNSMKLAEVKFTRAGQIYKAKPGMIHDEEKPKYNCYKPAYTGTFVMVDCEICDEHGNGDPEIGGSVPVYTNCLGKKLTKSF